MELSILWLAMWLIMWSFFLSKLLLLHFRVSFLSILSWHFLIYFLQVCYLFMRSEDLEILDYFINIMHLTVALSICAATNLHWNSSFKSLMQAILILSWHLWLQELCRLFKIISMGNQSSIKTLRWLNYFSWTTFTI
jgi:hypothetical protein